ncbi:MAG: murein biosynthesis integral membrane protein MurJ [Planctomycetes bacterium]|nr:murein biosynthesis integral membrane protein MurJ [Planctomycetota bacterium]
MSDGFERNTRTVTVLTLFSRLTGLARDATLSRVFGSGELMSAYFFAFMIPNLFRRLFGEGALSAAFLPTYTKLESSDPELARRLASLTVARLMVLLGVVTLLGEIILFFISLRADHANVAVWLMMLMLPYMPLVCLVAILGAMLQVHHRFGPTAAAPIILNLCIVTAATLTPFVFDFSGEGRQVHHVGIVAGALVVAGVLQVAWSLLALRRFAWWRSDYAAAREPFRKVKRLALPMIVGLGVLQLNTFFDGLIASYPAAIGSTIFGHAYPLGVDAMATVSFAQRLYQFPLGVFGIAVATAIFPLLARQADDDAAFADTVRRGLRLVVFIGLPASVGLLLVRHELAAVVLQGGQFTSDNTDRVAFVLLGYAPAIWAYSMVHVLTRAFYAKDDSMTPVKIAIGVVVLNLTLNCTLIWTPLREAGLAWSTAFCAIVQVSLLLLVVRRHVPHLINREVLLSWGQTIIAALPMTGVVMLFASSFSQGPVGWAESLGRLVLLVGSGGIIVAITALSLRMPELSWALGRKKS